MKGTSSSEGAEDAREVGAEAAANLLTARAGLPERRTEKLGGFVGHEAAVERERAGVVELGSELLGGDVDPAPARVARRGRARMNVNVNVSLYLSGNVLNVTFGNVLPLRRFPRP